MQSAFDILVTSGKAGKFKLKDMARYMASIAPAAAAVGLKGEEGLKRIVAMLQTVRAGTGSTEEAALSVANIFAKMEIKETAKKFKKFGIDLRKEMTTARSEGRDLLSVFTDLTELEGRPVENPAAVFRYGVRAACGRCYRSRMCLPT
jgi:hypothetical protein